MKASLALVLSTGVCLGLDSGIVTPSLAKYLESLQGDRSNYGVLIGIFWVARLCALPMFGAYIDLRSYGRAFRFAFALGVLGGIFYSLAALGQPFLCIALSRVFLGASSAVGVVSSGYIARFVSKEEMTRYVGVKGSIRGITSAFSPAFNLVFVAIPTFAFNGVEVFTSHTYCGYFIALFNLIMVFLFYFLFDEPERVSPLSDNVTDPLLEEEPLEDIDELSLRQRIWQTGAWLCFATSIQNNFHQQAVQWSIPLITSDAFGWGQLQNGYIFALAGVVGVISTCLVAFIWSKQFSDRTLYVVFQLLLGLGLVGFLLSSICGVTKPSLFACVVTYYVGNESQIAANIAIYVKLVGREDQGKAQAVLQMIMCLARFASALVLGLEQKGSLSTVWLIVLGVWSVQFPLLLCMWRKISPERIAQTFDTPSLQYRVRDD